LTLFRFRRRDPTSTASFDRYAGLAMLILLAATGPAPPQILYRNANIWDGLAHQPSRVGVREEEKQQGIRPSASERHSVDAELDRLSQMLLAQHYSQAE
jgi:hypothetical protein